MTNKLKKFLKIPRIAEAEDDDLIKMREDLVALIEQGQGDRFKQALSDLLEIERELTLREEDPR